MSLFLQQATILPESIMPEQFWTHNARFRSGSQRLMAAVLEDALVCLWNFRHGSKTREKRLFAETYEWAISADISYVFSFVNICYHVGLDPDDYQPKIKHLFGPYYQPEVKKEIPDTFVVPELVVLGIRAKGNPWTDGYEVEVYGNRLQLPYKSLREQRYLENGYQKNVVVSTHWAFKNGFLKDKPLDFRTQAGDHQGHKIATPRREERGVN